MPFAFSESRYQKDCVLLIDLELHFVDFLPGFGYDASPSPKQFNLFETKDWWDAQVHSRRHRKREICLRNR
jgi:hypothetical protein